MPALLAAGSEHATTRSTLRAVLRHSWPTVVESTLVPTALFYVAWVAIGPFTAYVAALAWGYGVLARRLVTGRRVPGLLVLALVGLTVRTALALATGSAFVYFAQPVLTTSVLALVFFCSALTARPLVARLAADFFPLTAEMAMRHGVRRLFRRLSMLWAGVHLVNALAAGGLLLALPTVAFVPTKTVVALVVTSAGVAATVVWSLRVARREGIVGARTAAALG